jgi:hypothetical protein
MSLPGQSPPNVIARANPLLMSLPGQSPSNVIARGGSSEEIQSQTDNPPRSRSVSPWEKQSPAPHFFFARGSFKFLEMTLTAVVTTFQVLPYP